MFNIIDKLKSHIKSEIECTHNDFILAIDSESITKVNDFELGLYKGKIEALKDLLVEINNLLPRAAR